MTTPGGGPGGGMSSEGLGCAGACVEGARQTRLGSLALPLTSYVASGNFLYFSEP